MKQRERIGLLPPVRTSDVLVFSSRRKPFRRRDNGVARTPRVRTPFFKRMARRLRTARLMERAGLRFVAAPRRLEAAYDDDRADARGEGRTDAVVEREREEEKEEHDEGPDDDGDAEDDDVDRSASSSDSDEIQITGEIAATPPPRGTAPSLTPAAAVAIASRALRLTLKRERGHGNCMFCAFASGLNSWLERGDARRPAGGTTSGPCPSARTPPRCTARSPVRTAAGSNGPTCAARWSGRSRTPSRMRERGTGTGS